MNPPYWKNIIFFLHYSFQLKFSELPEISYFLVCYSGPIGDFSSALHKIYAQFRKDIFSNKKFSIQKLDFDRSVCMTAICYSGSISVIPTIEQLHGEKRTCENFQNDISKIEGFVRVYSYR